MFRPIRVDHTNCLQVVIKTHSFIMWKLNSRTCKKRVSLSINKVGVYQSGRSFWLCISKFFFIKNCTYTTYSAREFTVVNSLVVNSNHYTTTHNYTYTVWSVRANFSLHYCMCTTGGLFFDVTCASSFPDNQTMNQKTSIRLFYYSFPNLQQRGQWWMSISVFDITTVRIRKRNNEFQNR
jgi:hypothetical protein